MTSPKLTPTQVRELKRLSKEPSKWWMPENFDSVNMARMFTVGQLVSLGLVERRRLNSNSIRTSFRITDAGTALAKEFP